MTFTPQTFNIPPWPTKEQKDWVMGTHRDWALKNHRDYRYWKKGRSIFVGPNISTFEYFVILTPIKEKGILKGFRLKDKRVWLEINQSELDLILDYFSDNLSTIELEGSDFSGKVFDLRSQMRDSKIDFLLQE